MITAKDLAAALNGREYNHEVTLEESKQARESGLVVVYAYSDDVMEFDGAICDAVGCYGGGTALLTRDGLLRNDCINDGCPNFIEAKQSAATIRAIWSEDHDGPAWSYETAIRHEAFNILENGELFCRGIVFELDDVTASRSPAKPSAHADVERDAARYRWLRTQVVDDFDAGICLIRWDADGSGHDLLGENADTLIDAAMRDTQKGQP